MRDVTDAAPQEVRQGSDSAPTELLRVERLTKRFPQVLANDAVSFTVRKGEIHCLLGENGAGKTTLAEMLYGVHKPDAGTIYYKGRPVSLSSPKDAIDLGIGMVHQHFVLVPPLPVVENVIIGTESSGLRLDLRQATQSYRHYVPPASSSTCARIALRRRTAVAEILKAPMLGSTC
jgi:simple sugar transport system ATP-binding protein